MVARAALRKAQLRVASGPAHARPVIRNGRVLQRALVEVADQAPHVPQGEARRKERTESRRMAVSALGRIGQTMPVWRIRMRVAAVEHLIAQFAPLVVGGGGRRRPGDADRSGPIPS